MIRKRKPPKPMTFTELERMTKSYASSERSDRNHQTQANVILHSRYSSQLDGIKADQRRRITEAARQAGYDGTPRIPRKDRARSQFPG